MKMETAPSLLQSLSMLSIALLLGYSNAEALVYQCVLDNGKIAFQDRPCTQANPQHCLPISYEKTQAKQLKTQKTALLKQAQHLKNSAQKKERERHKNTKERTQAQRKHERQLVRQARLQEKIERLENQLRQGCPLKRYNRIQAKLEEAQLLKRHYSKRD